MLPEIEQIGLALAAQQYVADAELATAVHLAGALGRPLLVEGEPGVGKTELAKAIARVRGARLIRLQCYEGLDASSALYEWNYLKQLLHIRLAEAAGERAREQDLFTREYLLARPLLEAITEQAGAPVLLIDEVDRADEEFEAFLLEILSDFAVSVPELGTITAVHKPFVVLTSNRTRELSDALRRRCLYLWLEYPDFDRELQILGARAPGLPEILARQIAGMMQVLRAQELGKPPGIAESLDWAVALMALHRDHLDPEAVRATLGCILKDPDDLRSLRGPFLQTLLDGIPGAAAGARQWTALARRLAPQAEAP